MEDWKQRTSILVGDNGVKILQQSHILIVGVGGVGGFACEMLARAGVGRLTIVDGDCVDITNKNRQIIALDSTIGMPKTQVFTDRIFDINSQCQVVALHTRFNKESAAQILEGGYDFVVDAIDSIDDKVELICQCQNRGLRLVSAMGAGKRLDMPRFEILDIFKTTYDKLAKKLRTKLKDCGVSGLDVCACAQPPQVSEGSIIGSISYAPAMSGCTIAAFVIKKLLSKGGGQNQTKS